MKCCVILYHKNILNIYKKEWIDKCINSIKEQTHLEFDIVELNYGDGEERYAEGVKPNYIFLNHPFENHIGAMNYLHNLCFNNGYDVVFNTNMDDFYHPDRFKIQLEQINRGAQLVSSNFKYVDENDKVFKDMNMLAKMCGKMLFEELERGHNVICHPVNCMHKSFWDDDLNYNDLIGKEDLDLWLRAIKKQKQFYICPEYFCFYRRHEKQITAVKKPKVCLLIIATNKYTKFVDPLLESAYEFFLNDCKVDYHVFTDKFSDITYPCDLHKIEHEEWPYVTLHRFHTFERYKEELQGYDYYFYIDADTLIKAPITAVDILSEITAVRHCGFTGKRGSYETRPESSSYVAPNEGVRYYGGGFWGLASEKFWFFIDLAIFKINLDANNGIIPVHHDESVLNRLLINTFSPTKVLSPSFHYPEGNIERYRNMWGRDYECKILLLDKNHEEIRK